MHARFLILSVAAAGLLTAQTFDRRATFRGGEPGRGKCTVEVVVDGAADVSIRGDMASLRNLSGRPPEWRRFECSGPLPGNPADFRFAGVDGRGKQQLIQDPRNGGTAVVRIEDRDNGAEGYTFDIFWSAYGGAPGQDDRYRRDDRGGPPPPPQDDRYRRDDRGGPPTPDDRYRRDDRGGDRDHDSFYRDRDAWLRGPDWRQRFFERIRQDLDHVQRVTFPFGADQYRIQQTKQQLDELQNKLARRYYDERELDDVIVAMRRVLQDNRLSRMDRDLLSDDLDRLRDFRARHDSYFGGR